MNGLDLLVKLGLPEALIKEPELWMAMNPAKAMQELSVRPLGEILYQSSVDSGHHLPSLDDKSGILKYGRVFEVVSYRDVSKPLPPRRAAEATGEEPQQQFTANRTLKLLLGDGSGRTFVAMEYESCPGLDDVRLNCKILLTDCYYHRGILLLNSSTCKVISHVEASVGPVS